MRRRREPDDSVLPAADGLWAELGPPVEIAALVARIEALEARADAQQLLLARYVTAADDALQQARMEAQHNRLTDQRIMFGLFDEMLRTLANDLGITSQPPATPPVPALRSPLPDPQASSDHLRFVTPDVCDESWLAPTPISV